MIDNKNTKPQLTEDKIQDVYIRKNFQSLNNYFSTQNQLYDFKFFDVTFDKAESNKKIEHGLSYVPQDVIVTKITGDGIVSFNHGLFDSKYINLSSDNKARVRFFVGSYWQSTNKENEPKSAVTEYSAKVKSNYILDLENRIKTLESLVVNDDRVIAYYYATAPTGSLVNYNAPVLGVFSPHVKVGTDWSFTAPKDGLYMFRLESHVIVIGGGYGSFSLYKNNVAYWQVFAGNNTVGYDGTMSVNLYKNDKVHILVNGGGTVSAGARIFIERIGDMLL